MSEEDNPPGNTAAPSPSPSSSTHNALSLGEIAEALTYTSRPFNGEGAAALVSSLEEDLQALRLPSLLRILHAAQPLSSVPTLSTAERPGRDRGQGGVAGEADGCAVVKKDKRSSDPLSPLLDRTVAALESVAASHPSSEGVEAVSVHLAPEACRRIGRCRTLKRVDEGCQARDRRRRRRDDDEEGDDGDGGWTSGLVEWDEERLTDMTVAASGGRKRKRATDDDADGGRRGSGLDDDDDDDDDEKADEKPQPIDRLQDAVTGIVAAAADDATAQLAAHKRMVAELLPVYQKMSGSTPTKPIDASSGKKRRSSPGGERLEFSELSALFRSAKSAEEDSVRSGVGCTLVEVAGLVASGLRNPPRLSGSKLSAKNGENEDESVSDKVNEDEDDDDDDDAVSSKSAVTTTVALPVKSDSVLAEPAAEDGQSAAPMGGADLPATVSAIMHYAPVLRHEHLANALCRSAVPCGPDIVASLAANCPPAVPPLLRGCIDAHLAASSASTLSLSTSGAAPADRAVLSSAGTSIRRIAALSPSEAWRAVAGLRDERRLLSPLSVGYAEGLSLALELTMNADAEAAVAMMLAELSRDGRHRLQQQQHQKIQSARENTVAPKEGPRSVRDAAVAARHRPGRGNDSQVANNDVDPNSSGRRRDLPAPRRGRRKIRPPRQMRKRLQLAPSNTSATGRTDLAQALSRNPNLASQAAECIASCLEKAASSESANKSIVWGHVALLARAFAALAYEVGLCPTAQAEEEGQSQSSLPYVEMVMTVLRKIASYLPPANATTPLSEGGSCSLHSPMPLSCPGDEYLCAALCSCAVTCARLVDRESNGRKDNDIAALGACIDCLNTLLRLSVSRTSDAFASRLSGAISAKDGSGLDALVREVLFGINYSEGQGLNDANLQAERSEMPRALECGKEDLSFVAACVWASSKVDSEVLSAATKRGWQENVVVADIRAVLVAVVRRQVKVHDLEGLLKSVLADPSKCASAFVQKEVVPLIFSQIGPQGGNLDGNASQIPLFLPLQIEKVAKGVSWKLSDLQASFQVRGSECIDYKDNPIRCQFVLQLLYVLKFAHQVPDSPFAVDPLSLPVGSALLFCRTLLHADAVSERQKEAISVITSTLEDLFARLCPEVLSMTPDGSLLSFDDALSGLSSTLQANKVLPTTVAAAIRGCLKGGDNADPAGRVAERLFLKSRADFPSAEVDAQVCAALLSSQHSPLRIRSYSSLCRDPLVLLRCNVGSWRCCGLRRILLSVLRRLLDANDFIAREEVPSESVALELLAARDALVTRCLLVADSCSYCFDGDTENGCSDGTPAASRCPMTVSLVRYIVSKRRGLVAVLVKQGLSNAAVDLLAELVPESLGDAPALSILLSERNTLTAAERLSVADASLRIVIAHGISAAAKGSKICNSNQDVKKLAFAALSTCVSSFFLVLGPVGVPVDAVCEEDGRDLTSQCRNSTFRMIEAMQKIGCHRTELKNEAKIALAKMASFCKSEGAMGGVGGAAAVKRKALLKELWDLTMRSIATLGGGV
uniref:Uncharacterized protein n=1 Tax=Odontella aurita TaxID=265563 RepID=A0A7S4M5P6_9STRA|mmetsp:Transcript_11395/g.33570  ORF Transcript_11395/g.33570 Transcript_11395/m.33570 type:complete len:1526 (+) Transcript_11395:26-4603(+)